MLCYICLKYVFMSTILPYLKRVWITVSIIILLELRLPLLNFLSPAFVAACSLSSSAAVVLVCISFAGRGKTTTTKNKQKYRILLLPTQWSKYSCYIYSGDWCTHECVVVAFGKAIKSTKFTPEARTFHGVVAYLWNCAHENMKEK